MLEPGTSKPAMEWSSTSLHSCSRTLERPAILAAALFALSAISGEVELVIDTSKRGEAIDLTRFALGQGGLSDQPMFDSHVEQIAQLHPQTIRIFVQEYFELYPKRRHY